ncbi:unnamed protein product, partial [Pylaiella littoralis]
MSCFVALLLVASVVFGLASPVREAHRSEKAFDRVNPYTPRSLYVAICVAIFSVFILDLDERDQDMAHFQSLFEHFGHPSSERERFSGPQDCEHGPMVIGFMFTPALVENS